MQSTRSIRLPARLILTLAFAAPGVVLAYDEQDAIRDCENRIRSEYRISDLRDATAQRLSDTLLHFKVQGLAKVDGDKHPWTCEVKNRHVTSAEYRGPKPKGGLSPAGTAAVGAAVLAAGAVAANEYSKSHAGGAKELHDLVGAKGSSGEAELEKRGYKYVSGKKSGASSYTNWVKNSHCVTVRTADGRYTTILDAPMSECK